MLLKGKLSRLSDYEHHLIPIGAMYSWKKNGADGAIETYKKKTRILIGYTQAVAAKPLLFGCEMRSYTIQYMWN